MEHENQPTRVVGTTIRLPVPTWRALRRLAESAALRDGGRPSLSRTVARLIASASASDAARNRRAESGLQEPQ